jgi:hypothetical protein
MSRPQPEAGARRAGLGLLIAPRRPAPPPAAPAADAEALRPFAKRFCARMAEALSTRYGLRAGFAPQTDPAGEEPGPGLIAVIAAQGGEDGRARLTIGQSALYDIVEALFGGDGAAQPYRDARAPSELERAIVEGLGPSFAQALGEALERDDLRHERVAREIEEAGADLVATQLKMRLVGRETHLTLCAPRAWLGLADADAPASAAPTRTAPLSDLALDLRVSLRDPGRLLAEIVGLSVGEVLPLTVSAATPARLDAEGVDLFEATLGQSAGRYTIRLERRLGGAIPVPEEFTQ